MKTELYNFFKKIIFLSVLIIPNIVNADFFKDITAKIADNPKRLSYGIIKTDKNIIFLKKLHNLVFIFISLIFFHPIIKYLYCTTHIFCFIWMIFGSA